MNKGNKKFLTFIISIILAIVWGWYQPTILPIETFGPLCFITSFVGGWFISFIMGYVFDRIDGKEE